MSEKKTEKKQKRGGVKSTISLDKLEAALRRKPHTAAELATLFKRSAIAVKRQIEKLPGVKTELRPANGKVGRRPNVYSLA
jgi:response regulator of citrate/malate metabolism